MRRFIRASAITGNEDVTPSGWCAANGTLIGIWVSPRCERKIVCHECHHAFKAALRAICSEGLDEEFCAYLHAHITDTVIKKWEAYSTQGI